MFDLRERTFVFRTSMKSLNDTYGRSLFIGDYKVSWEANFSCSQHAWMLLSSFSYRSTHEDRMELSNFDVKRKDSIRNFESVIDKYFAVFSWRYQSNY